MCCLISNCTYFESYMRHKLYNQKSKREIFVHLHIPIHNAIFSLFHYRYVCLVSPYRGECNIDTILLFNIIIAWNALCATHSSTNIWFEKKTLLHCYYYYTHTFWCSKNFPFFSFYKLLLLHLSGSVLLLLFVFRASNDTNNNNISSSTNY